MAAALPWSTTATTALLIIWLFILLPTIELASFSRSLMEFASLAPIIFFLLAVVGMVWAEGEWAARLDGLGPVAKLLVLPFLLYHYGRSTRAHWVFKAFLISCTLLLIYSWMIFLVPEWRFTTAHGFDTTGVPIRNAIDQNQEFSLCSLGLAALAVSAFRQRRRTTAAALGLLAAVFLCNILFVAFARTSILYILPLAVIFVFRHFNRRRTLSILVGLAAAAMLVWGASPYLRDRIEHIAIEYKEYRETNRPTSTGQRLTYWTQSLGWISEAPVLGHGTGSTSQLFERVSAGKEGAWAQRIRNPHNQTLYVAIQWGLLGCVVLYAMWYRHYRLFRAGGFVGWIGMIVVIQNVISSLLNSHLFDFNEGWIYVLGVGVAGGVQRVSSELNGRRNIVGPHQSGPYLAAGEKSALAP